MRLLRIAAEHLGSCVSGALDVVKLLSAELRLFLLWCELRHFLTCQTCSKEKSIASEVPGFIMTSLAVV